MKKFEMPEIWLELFVVEDVVTSSGSGSESESINESGNENQLPIG